MHIPNSVSAILGSFRGFDTMCETIVILVAALVVLGILSMVSKTLQSDEDERNN